jgi:hypothetical protein
VHGKSAHVDLTFSLAPMTVGKRKLDTHRLMHLYLERIESIRRSFCELFALTDRDFPLAGEQVSPRLQIYMLGDPADHRELTPRVTGISAAGAGVKLMGATSVYCMLDDKRILPDDEAVHRNIAHSVAHLLLANALPCAWIGNKKHGWVDEGVAHYFEYRVDGRCSNFCYEEVGLAPGANFAGGRWRVAIRKLVEAGDSRKFTAIYTKNSDQLDFVDHAHAFAYVEFLIARYGGERFADFVRLVKRKTPTRDALRDAFGISLLAFDDAFSEWVRATYPLRAKDRR